LVQYIMELRKGRKIWCREK